MKKLLAKTSNWKLIIPALLCCVYCIMLFQKAQSEMSQICGHEVEMIDVRNNYTLDEINNFFTNLKSEGRQIHRHATAVVDMVFPLGYGILFILISAFFLNKITHDNSNWLYLSLFPILLMLVDVKENFNTLNLLEKFPNLTKDMVQSAAKVTYIKSMLVNACLGLILILGIVFLIKWASNKYKVTSKK